jgi:DNA helicase-2/ATP-dependent DNA helicase PcrA
MTTIASDTLLIDVDRHARVTAGPGAGKTYWLAEHTKNVIRRSKKLHSHARIGVISYTNIAADELKQKLGNDAARATTGTIHSFLYTNVIKPYLYLLKSRDGQSVVNTAAMDGHDEHHVSYGKLNTWLESVNHRQILAFPDQTDTLKDALKSIRWEQDGESAQWTLGIHPPEWIERKLGRLIKAKLTAANLLSYKKLYWADGILDHDDVLYFATRILNEYPLIASCLSARYPFLFIDEFQDTVPAQTNVVQFLAAQGTTVVVIGDAEQSIFAFAGAQPEHFRRFALTDIDEYVIENNRRSTNRILTLLNQVRNDKLTQQGTRNMEGEKIRLIIGSIAQATQHVKSLLPQNEGLLIVARNGKLVQEVQVLDTLNADTPWGAIDAADSDRERFLHQLLAGVVLARRQRFGSAVTTILRGIGHTKGNLRKPFRSVASSTALQRRAIAVALLEALIALGPELEAMTLRATYDHCCSTLSSGFKNLLLTKIIRGKKFAEVAEKYRCEILLRTVKLTSGEEVRELRTIHQAKGTEWQNVLAFLIGRNENETQDQIKHILNPAALSDEEKRVTYVAISRARDRLFLATPTLTTAQEQEATDLGIDVTHLDAVQLRLL